MGKLVKEYANATLIQHAVTQVAGRLNRELMSNEFRSGCVALVVMNGAMMFAADLLRQLKSEKIIVESCSVQSYNGTRPGDLGFRYMPVIANTNVLMIDEICDKGHTLRGLKGMLEQTNNVVKTCTLLKKKIHSAVFEPDYYPIQCSDHFLVGYGLDYKGYYRNLPGIWIYEE